MLFALVNGTAVKQLALDSLPYYNQKNITDLQNASNDFDHPRSGLFNRQLQEAQISEHEIEKSNNEDRSMICNPEVDTCMFTNSVEVDLGSENYILEDERKRISFDTITKLWINLQNHCNGIDDIYHGIDTGQPYEKMKKKGKGKGRCKGKRCPQKVVYSYPSKNLSKRSNTQNAKDICEITLLQTLKQSNDEFFGELSEIRLILSTESSLEPLRESNMNQREMIEAVHEQLDWSVRDLSAHECSWNYISCDSEDNIIRLDLNGWYTDLNLRQYATIPTEIGSFRYLSFISIENNNVRGTVPTEVGLLERVNEIELDNNALTGTIPKELYQLRNLWKLELDGNQLTGTISTEIGFLTKLVLLEYDENMLTGTIPTELGLLKDLLLLELSENMLEGTIPTEIGFLQEMLVLELDQLMLTGTIPTQLGLLQNMYHLELDENTLTCTIPTELGLLIQLKLLELGENSLCGTIPSELGRLQKIEDLWLEGNRLTGTIPTEFGLITKVQRLFLQSNSLTGTLPTEIGGLTSLYVLYIAENFLTGSIPTELGQLTNLELLFLQSNCFNGNVPEEICDLDINDADFTCEEGFDSEGSDNFFNNDLFDNDFLDNDGFDFECRSVRYKLSLRKGAMKAASVLSMIMTKGKEGGGVANSALETQEAALKEIGVDLLAANASVSSNVDVASSSSVDEEVVATSSTITAESATANFTAVETLVATTSSNVPSSSAAEVEAATTQHYHEGVIWRLVRTIPDVVHDLVFVVSEVFSFHGGAP